MTLNVLNYAIVDEPRDKTNKQLRQELKYDFAINGRRLDNFTLTAMKAVAKIAPSLNSENRYALFSAAQYFSLELLQSLLLDLAQNTPLKPLDFVATVGNAANYYLAKQFNLEATNLFLGCTDNKLSKTLLVAELDLSEQNSDAAIIVIWQESEKTRRCYALLVELAPQQATNVNAHELIAQLDAGAKTPFVVN